MMNIEEFKEYVAHPFARIKGTQTRGWLSEIRAAEVLQQQGYRNIRMAGGGQGPDIVATSPEDAEERFEVKTASPIGNGKTWVVPRVYPNRTGDDFVLVVLPNQKVLRFPMSDHLAACGPTGRRTITEIVREHYPEMGPRGRPGRPKVRSAP